MKRFPIHARFLALELFCLTLRAAESPGWFDPGWSHRVSVAVAADVGAETNCPVLVLLDPQRIDYRQVRPDTGDLRFVADDQTTVFPHEVDRWNPGGRSVLWVRLPVLQPGVRFHLYFGNPSATAASAQAPVWDDTYALVMHLSETNGPHRDQSPGAHHSAGIKVRQQGTGRALIGGADEFGHEDQWIRIPDSPDFDLGKTATWELLLAYDNEPNANHSWWSHAELDGAFTNGWWLGCREVGANENHDGNPYVSVNNVDIACKPEGGMRWEKNRFYHVAFVVNGNRGTVYRDGVDLGGWWHDSIQIHNRVHGDMHLGCEIGPWMKYLGLKKASSLSGSLDEARLSKVARSTHYIQAQFKGYRDQLLRYTAPETRP
jgi:hypothetical protein